jgi:ubiquinone/menaquinone biosynthesis C-methylase UbiE
MEQPRRMSKPLNADADAGRRTAQRFWARYFNFYDTLNEAAPYRRMIERHAALLEPAPGELILDAGTGTGNVAVELLKSGARVVGIDFVESALEKCRAKAPAGDFRFGDLTRPLEFAAGHFDKVACCCVLHVLGRDAQGFVVREFFRVVRPGGLVALTAFAEGFNPFTVYRATLGERSRSAGTLEALRFGLTHSLNTARIMYYVFRIKRREQTGEYNFLTREGLRAMLERAGFEVVLEERTFAGQCVNALARKPGTA